jgi:predicted transcriptional regulator
MIELKPKVNSKIVSDINNKNNDNLNTELILNILGNSTRRKILFLLQKNHYTLINYQK